MSSHDGREPRDDRASGSKHEVFLSHSKPQKDFVEQLDKDLRDCGYSPFFDLDPDSLPITEDTTDNIRAAIRQCRLGVLFLSEEFFMRSIWPMFELAHMVQSGTKVMPIFYGISPADLANDEYCGQWFSKWEEWSNNEKDKLEKEKLVNISAWKSAFETLKPTQGLIYIAEERPVNFRARIVEEIRSTVSIFVDNSDVQGGPRICKMICEKIYKSPESRSCQNRVVGLYGVGGIGKTTSCKYLRVHYYQELRGRVCHIELGPSTSEKDRLDKLLKELMNKNSADWTIEKCRQELTFGLQSERIFLAIDNVLDERKIYTEARRYIKLGASDSIVLVTARSLEIVKELGIDCYIPMPELEEHEAKALFLAYAKPPHEVDNSLLNQCIRRCLFSKGDGSSHYHPLALKVLGSLLELKGETEWWSQLQNKETFNPFQEKEDGVLSVLRSSYDDLSNSDYKLMFLDLALFDTETDYGLSKGLLETLGKYKHYNCRANWNVFEWLSMVHGIRIEEVQLRLDHLKRKSLLEELGTGFTRIGVHDLWREFAVMEAKATMEEKGEWRWLYEIVERNKGGGSQESKLSGGGSKKLRRISISRSSIVNGVDFSDCSHATVLKLVDVEVEGKVLNVTPLKRLKSLSIEEYGNSDPKGLEVIGLKDLGQLKVLSWKVGGICPSTITFPTNLRILHLSDNSHAGSRTLDLRELSSLEEASFQLSGGENVILGLSSNMTKLRILKFTGLSRWTSWSFPDGVDVKCLQVLVMEMLGRMEMLPSLHQLTKLQILHLHGSPSVTKAPGLGNLVALRELRIASFRSLRELPDLGSLKKLQKLDIWDCTSLIGVPGLGSLFALLELHIWECSSLRELPNLGSLKKLQKLDISDFELLTEVPGLGSLLALLELCIHCSSLRELPDLGSLKKLQKLDIWDCTSLIGVPGLGSLFALLELHIWDCSSLRELPNLGSLKKLQKLDISRCELLTEVPGLGSLLALLELGIHCYSLRELPDLGSHKKLQMLDISWCALLTAVPGLGMLDSLEELQACSCKNLEKLPDVSNLRWLRILDISGCELLTEVRGLESLFAMRELCAKQCSKLRELPDLGSLKKLQKLDISRCELLTAVPGLGMLDSLEELQACSCKNLEKLPDVSNLRSLRILDISGCELLTEVPGLESLFALRQLCAKQCSKLRELPDLGTLKKLQKLNISGCELLTEVPGLGMLDSLEELRAYGCKNLEKMPDVSNLWVAHVVELP